MKADVLLGLQWGDEGKGKIVDVLTPRYDVVCRFQGGPNAGHSLHFNNNKYVLHTIPSGIFHENIINVIGNGVVIDPVILRSEIEGLESRGVEFRKNLYVSKKAHLILPSHRAMDALNEFLKGKSKIGSTLKGIGPTYTDKVARNGLRVGDILQADFEARYRKLTSQHQAQLDQFQFEYDFKEYEQQWLAAIEVVRSLQIIDSEHVVNAYIKAGKRILAEGAQGTLLDVDFGSYPFVTSSNTISAGACTGLGIAPRNLGEVLGIFKAYCTRVGSGPFPTELFDQTGEDIRQKGFEFGSTTGRPRRCGWLDMPALKYSIMINGVSSLIMMKSDVLDELDTVKVAVAYQLPDGSQIDYFPYDTEIELTPIYKEFKGWKVDTSNMSEINQLPKELLDYIEYIEKEAEVPISIVSVGPDRKATIFR